MAAQLATKQTLTLEVAKQMAAAAAQHAAKNNWTMVIAIVDDGGNLMYLEKMDETQIGSIEVAQAKARTSIRYKRPTKALEDAVAGGRNVVMTLPGATPVEGGLPITVDGKIIGAIGLSGMASNQDGECAKAALDALPKILGR
jgi:glc operon protein GlcG